METDDAKKKTGPKKHKTQITLRLDKKLMDEAKAQMAASGMRLTDIIERSLLLELEEKGAELPQWTEPHQIKYALDRRLTREEERMVRGLAIAMKETEIQPRSDNGEAIWKLVENFLLRANGLPHAQACIDEYAKRKPRALRDN